MGGKGKKSRIVPFWQKNEPRLQQPSGERLEVDRAIRFLINDVKNFKIEFGNEFINARKLLNGMQRDLVFLSNSMSAFMDLVSDITNIPKQLLTQKFVALCDARQVSMNDGSVNGEVKVSKYNFGGQSNESYFPEERYIDQPCR
jgi:hypothetical protein